MISVGAWNDRLVPVSGYIFPEHPDSQFIRLHHLGPASRSESEPSPINRRTDFETGGQNAEILRKDAGDPHKREWHGRPETETIRILPGDRARMHVDHGVQFLDI